MRLLPWFRRGKVPLKSHRTVKRPTYAPGAKALDAHPDEYYRQLWEAIDRLPWFGQLIERSSAGRRLPSERLTLQDHQLILLSWLAGGPTSKVARRAGVSRRVVYDVIARLIYVSAPRETVAYWHDLGLIVGVVTPWLSTVPGSSWQGVMCLICHQPIVMYNWQPMDLEPGDVFRTDPMHNIRDGDYDRYWGELEGHIIFHFWLEDSPLYLGMFTPGRFEYGSWARVDKHALRYVKRHYYVRATETRPRITGMFQDEKTWRKWRRSVLEARRSTSIPQPPPSDRERDR